MLLGPPPPAVLLPSLGPIRASARDPYFFFCPALSTLPSIKSRTRLALITHPIVWSFCLFTAFPVHPEGGAPLFPIFQEQSPVLSTQSTAFPGGKVRRLSLSLPQVQGPGRLSAPSGARPHFFPMSTEESVSNLRCPEYVPSSPSES